MGRILFWLILALVAWLLWRQLAVARRAAPPPAARPDLAPVAEPMVSCAVCGLNVPQSEARGDGAVAAGADAARWFCSDEHLRVGNGH
jgi:uncharacterized protein